MRQGHVSGLVERPQLVEAVTPVHVSDMTINAQHHLPFFGTLQKIEGVEQPCNRL